MEDVLDDSWPPVNLKEDRVSRAPLRGNRTLQVLTAEFHPNLGFATSTTRPVHFL